MTICMDVLTYARRCLREDLHTITTYVLTETIQRYGNAIIIIASISVQTIIIWGLSIHQDEHIKLISNLKLKEHNWSMWNFLTIYECPIGESPYACLEVPSLNKAINLLTTSLNCCCSLHSIRSSDLSS